jgi:pyruvate kinase
MSVPGRFYPFHTLALANHTLFKSISTRLQVILCADGSITLTVMSCNPDKGTVVARCENTAMLGERKNVNLPGVIVDLPTVTPKVRSLEE